MRQHIATLTGHTSWIGSVVFSPDGGTLASGSADTTVRLWQESDQETQTFTVAEDDTGDPVSPPPSTTTPPTTSGFDVENHTLY